MSDSLAAPACSIEIYPFEQGKFTLTGGQIVTVSVRKDLHNNSASSFDVQLTPGGPYGVESPVTWDQVITPMSHILIGMSRGADAAIVLDGIVTSTAETQAWRTNPDGSSAAGRGQGFAGSDFSWFYRTFNYYALTFYGLTAGTPVGGALDFLPGPIASKISQGLIGGNSAAQSNPVAVGKAWYDGVMAGSGAILGKTYVPYAGGNRISFTEIMNTTWENYPNVFIPLADFFMVGDEAWMDKFQGIFPFPWYEFFVTTAPANFYTPQSGGVTQTPGSLFTMASMPGAPSAGPTMVSRVTPTPFFDISGNGDSFTPGNLDVSRWNALPLFDFTQRPYGFFQSNINFSANGARNFYQLNPTGYSVISTNNASNIPFPFQFIAAADPASVQRYGFRPQLGTTRWMFDPQGGAAQNPGINVQNTMFALTGKMISWFHPVPLMATADVVIPLSPSAMVGTRFRYAPFKSGEPWDFYVESVEHRFEFGGANQSSWTRLSLSRGLPVSVYEDASDGGVLRAIHLGNARREDGVYLIGLPPGAELPLQIIASTDQAAALNQHLATVFATPQSGAS